MDSNMTVIDRVGQLMTDIQKKVDNGVIQLSAKEWEALDRSLQRVPQLLAIKSVSEKRSKSTDRVVVTALKKNATLAQHFADELATLTALTGGTILTGRRLSESNTQERLLKNKMITLSFVKWIKQKIESNNRTTQGR
jgi:hypothetical protein